MRSAQPKPIVEDEQGKEPSEKNDETKDNINGGGKTKGFTGFFKKLSSKKSSSDVGAKNEINANSITKTETENESTDNHETVSDKNYGEENSAKKRVSFFQKIGLKKKSSETSSSTNEEKKEDDDLSSVR